MFFFQTLPITFSFKKPPLGDRDATKLRPLAVLPGFASRFSTASHFSTASQLSTYQTVTLICVPLPTCLMGFCKVDKYSCQHPQLCSTRRNLQKCL